MEYPNGRMSDEDIRELCNRFFDAYQDRKLEELADTMSENCVIWQGPYNRIVSKQDLIKASPAGWALHRRRTYDERQINTFDGGFVIRYALNLIYHSGEKAMRWLCIVALCRDGKIYRVDEYMDTQHIKGWVPPPRQSDEETEYQAFLNYGH
jgi:ketosteroid isomerase-like protein